MDQFGDYREIISLPNPPIEDLAAGDVGLELARIGNDAMAELCARLNAIFQEYMARPPTADGTKYGLAFTVHRLRERHH